MKLNVVILATRIAGTDGVSLEAVRWREILERMGQRVEFIAGELDWAGTVIPELHFKNPNVVKLHDKVVYGNEDYKSIEARIFALAGVIEGKLREVFNSHKKVDLLIVPNVLSLPMHFPFAVGLARVIEELGINTIARHHDFWWERQRYLNSSMFPFFKRWFPPKSSFIKHVVINSTSQKELKERTGIESDVIWDSFDFSSDKGTMDNFSKHFRGDFNLKETDIVFLQPTRIVPRKRIEISIDLIKELNDPNAFFVAAGYGGDEAGNYEKKVRLYAKESGIRYKFIGKHINSHRKVTYVANGERPIRRRVYTLWDAFLNCDFVTYPTQVEGFGNQFVEAVFFKKPIILTPYEVYKKDIAPLGFEVIEMPNRVTKRVLDQVRFLMGNKNEVKRMVEKNFELGKKYFSYEWVQKKMVHLIT